MSVGRPGEAAGAGWAGACRPVTFDAAAPGAGAAEYLSDPAVAALDGFFRAKGLGALKAADRAEEWYEDWLAYQAGRGLYAALLSPERWSGRGGRFDLRRLARFLEVFAWHSPAHAYSLHVSFLGLWPILSGTNDALKREAVGRLEGGGLFAFAVSEKAHGSDLFAGEFTVRRAGPAEPGPRIADGEKYYIGNANAACMVSVLATHADARGEDGRRPPFTFLAIRPGESPAWRKAGKIRTLGIRGAFVGSFEVRGHAFADDDVIAEGRDAWDAVFRTVDLGKFLLGFGVIGICEHAMSESLAHLRSRVLYGRPVAEIPHIRVATALAFARLAAMKAFATRALDYLQAAGKDDRRYLLFNAVQKARVSTEGVKVLGLLSGCVGARGLESETYFEGALRDAQLIPGLEGSTHINFAFAAQFLGPYFAAPRAGEAEVVPPPHLAGPAPENEYHFGSRNRNPKSVRFADPIAAYGALPPVPNAALFARQVAVFRRFASAAFVARDHTPDSEVTMAIGACIATAAYGQVVAEKFAAIGTSAPLVSVAFHALVGDFTAEVLRLMAALGACGASRAGLARAVRVPRTADAEFEAAHAELVIQLGAETPGDGRR